MMSRILWVAMAVLGLLAAVAVLAAGADLARSVATGPRWKRRLLSSGLVLLAMLGVAKGTPPRAAPGPAAAAPAAPAGSPGRAAPAPAGAPATAPAKDPLLESAEWKRIDETWKEAENPLTVTPFGKFTQAKREELLNRVAGLYKDIAALGKAGLLTEAEAGLLDKELPSLKARTKQYPAVDDPPSPMCYVMMPNWEERKALGVLTDRLPLLKKLAEQKRIQPDVARRCLATIEDEAKVLADGVSRTGSDTVADYELRQVAVLVQQEVAQAVYQVRKTLGWPATQPAEEPVATQNYTVKAGDTLFAIAKKLLGDGGRWREIIRLNPDVDAAKLQVGWMLVVPKE